MRTTISVIIFVLFASNAIAQVKDPAKWTASSRKKGGGYQVVLSAALPKGWHIYSQKKWRWSASSEVWKLLNNPVLPILLITRSLSGAVRCHCSKAA